VTDASGCRKTASSNVTIYPQLTLRYFLSDTILHLGDTLTFRDSTLTANSWNWNFGNGFGNLQQSGSYIYPDTGTYRVQLTVSNGYCSDSVVRTIRVIEAVSTDPLLKQQILLYPNPTKGMLYLEPKVAFDNTMRLKILTITGQTLNETEILPGWQERMQLDMNYPAGMYFLQLQTPNGHQTWKIVIE
ncbi:MAG: T9SS type A sorting domain-containing protein, partial [Bacteroidia bacterium]|nr:T9SS type A sorting domain-containing protein [Bacteroidia bacterium]